MPLYSFLSLLDCYRVLSIATAQFNEKVLVSMTFFPQFAPYRIGGLFIVHQNQILENQL